MFAHAQSQFYYFYEFILVIIILLSLIIMVIIFIVVSYLFCFSLKKERREVRVLFTTQPVRCTKFKHLRAFYISAAMSPYISN